MYVGHQIDPIVNYISEGDALNIFIIFDYLKIAWQTWACGNKKVFLSTLFHEFLKCNILNKSKLKIINKPEGRSQTLR